MAAQEKFIHNGRYVTALVYFVLLEGTVAIPSSLTPVVTADVATHVNFSSIRDEEFVLLSLNSPDVKRALYAGSFYLDRPIITSDVQKVENMFQIAWESLLSEFVTVSLELQEPVLSESG